MWLLWGIAGCNPPVAPAPSSAAPLASADVATPAPAHPEPEPAPAEPESFATGDVRLFMTVTGVRWYWTTEYRDMPDMVLTTHTERDQTVMLLPTDTVVELKVTSKDVTHHLSIPLLGVFAEAAPGQTAVVRVRTPKTPAVGRMMCTSDCGELSSKMAGRVEVVSSKAFAAKAEQYDRSQREGETFADYGARLYEAYGCNACHTVDGSEGTGPTWKGLWGSTRALEGGDSVEVVGSEGDNYVTESILSPRAKVAAGYQPNMPSYASIVPADRVLAFVEYIKTLK